MSEPDEEAAKTIVIITIIIGCVNEMRFLEL